MEFSCSRRRTRRLSLSQAVCNFWELLQASGAIIFHEPHANYPSNTFQTSAMLAEAKCAKCDLALAPEKQEQNKQKKCAPELRAWLFWH